MPRNKSNKKWDDSLPKKGTAAWENASKAEKEEAITYATEFIDTLPFKGEHLRRAQALAWPRKGVFRDDGVPIVGVPEEVEEATVMVAGFILAKVSFDVPATRWVMLKLGHLFGGDKDIRKGRTQWH
jgi:hypothetical protein